MEPGGIFPDLSPRAKPYCGVKYSQGLHFPATPFIGKQDSSSTHRRTGRGGEGGCSLPPPPKKNWGNSDFLGQREKIWAKPVFKDVPVVFKSLNEEIKIFYFNLKLA